MLEKLNIYCPQCKKTTEHAVIGGRPVMLWCKVCRRQLEVVEESDEQE